jgi:hypothetical protein
VLHLDRIRVTSAASFHLRHEPHWFDPGLLLSAQDAITISVIDEVYPEIRLADRVAVTRESLRRRVFPEVQEPAHFQGQEIIGR